VSPLTPETTSADVLEIIQQEFPSQNITVGDFKFPYVRRISSFKISAPPEIFNVLNSISFLIAVTSFLTSERKYFLNPNDIEFVGVKVSLKSFSIYVTCSYIAPRSDLTIYEQHLSAIKTVLSHHSERDVLIVLGDFNLPDISWSPSTDSLVSTPLSDHDFVDGLLELLLRQVSFIHNSLNRQLDLVFVLDPSEVTVSRIDPIVVPEDQYHPTLELTNCLPCVDTLSPLLSPTKSRCFRK